jgi:hypothetical protein
MKHILDHDELPPEGTEATTADGRVTYNIANCVRHMIGTLAQNKSLFRRLIGDGTTRFARLVYTTRNSNDSTVAVTRLTMDLLDTIVANNYERVSENNKSITGSRTGLFIGSIISKLIDSKNTEQRRVDVRTLVAGITTDTTTMVLNTEQCKLVPVLNPTTGRITLEPTVTGSTTTTSPLITITKEQKRAAILLHSIIEGTYVKPRKYDVCATVAWFPANSSVQAHLTTPLGLALSGFLTRKKKLPRNMKHDLFGGAIGHLKNNEKTYHSERHELWKYAVDQKDSDHLATRLYNLLVKPSWVDRSPRFDQDKPE